MLPWRRTSFALALLAGGLASAAIYEAPITAETEQDLLAAEQRGELSSTTVETLLEMLDEGVDLNGSSRDELYDLPGLTYLDVDAIIAYRTTKGRIEDPAELVGAEAITPEQLLQIAPFIRIDARGLQLPVSGKVEAVTAATAGDNVAPPALLKAKLKGPWDLSAGFMLDTVRRLSGAPRYDPLLDTLVTDGLPYQVMAPRLYAMWQGGKRKIIVGTFNAGFAERLILDNSRHNTPHGFYLTEQYRRPPDLGIACKLSPKSALTGDCADPDHTHYITQDFLVRDSFRGAAASLEDVPIGTDGSLSAFGFLSWQSKSLYQYELIDKRTCDDFGQGFSGCTSPRIYVDDKQNPGLVRLAYATVPYLYDELVGGAHFEVKPTYRFRLGVTGYGAAPFFHQDMAAMQLDFNSWSRTPAGGSYGAIGLDAHTSYEGFNFFLEAGRSFDHVPQGGGGWGVVQRSTWSPKHHELELSFRFYDDKFGNPYGRPVSAPDLLEGQRARNEVGTRVRWAFTPNRDWVFKTRADFWVTPYDTPTEKRGTANLMGQARVDFDGFRRVQFAGWLEVRNRNLGVSGNGGCDPNMLALYAATGSFGGEDTMVCKGDLTRLAARVDGILLAKWLEVSAQSYFQWVDDIRSTRPRNDLMVWGEVRSDPLPLLHLRARSRLLWQDANNVTNFEHLASVDPTQFNPVDLPPGVSGIAPSLQRSLWSLLEAEFAPMRSFSLLVRYDVFVWLDRRQSTIDRLPNPEHRFFLDVKTSF